MPENMNDKGQFQPLHDAHAIEQVLLGVHFPSVLDEAGTEEVRKTAAQFEKDLPGRVDGTGMTIAGGGKMMQSAMTSWRRAAPDGTVTNELRADGNSVIYRTTTYSRWDTVWSQTKHYFEALLPIYLRMAKVSGVSLHYVDKFVWIGEPATCRASSLLRERSQYVAPHVYALDDLWHSHTGKFTKADNATKRLLNLNVDCIDEQRREGLRRVIAIATNITDMFNQPGYLASELDVAGIDTRLNQLHDYCKDVFGEVINDLMTKRIALKD